MTTIALPRYSSFYQWANNLKISLNTLIVPVPPRDEANWRVWANSLISINTLTYITIPTKTMFPNSDDWRKWAFLFIKNYNQSS